MTTSNRFVAVFMGVLVTILIQRSAATDMMVIGFVNSGLMTLMQAIGVIMGANIGTTITAQITAFNKAICPPAVAIRQAQLEITRMGRIASENLNSSVECFFNPTDDKYRQVEDTEDTVNYLTHAITQKLVKVRTFNMTGHERNRITQMTLAVSDLERISDHAINIAEYALQLKQKKTALSDKAMGEIKTLSQSVTSAVDFCIDIFESDDFDKLDEAEKQEQAVDELEKKLLNNHIARLFDRQCDPHAGVIFTNIASDLERCSDHAINIAFALHNTTSALSHNANVYNMYITHNTHVTYITYHIYTPLGVAASTPRQRRG